MADNSVEVQMVAMPLPPPTWGQIPSVNSLLQRSESKASVSRRTVQLNSRYFAQAQRWLSFIPASAAICLGSVNIIAARYEFFSDLLQPGHPIICPILLFVVGLAAMRVGCRTDLERVELSHQSPYDDEDEEGLRKRVSCMKRFLHTLTPGGRNFHRKVQFCKAVGILNMALVLQTSLETGQLRRYIMAQALIILVNALAFPLLLTRPHAMYHTIGMMFMDIGIDAVFGAALPICMGLELAVSALWNRKELEREQVPVDNHVRFLIVANRFVPPNTRDMVQLLIPYVTLTLRLGDVRKARKLLNLGGLPSAGWCLLHKRVATIAYGAFGTAIFLGSIWRCFLYHRCSDSKDLKWGAGCLQQSYYTMDKCRCIYFSYETKLVNGPYKGETLTVSDMDEMLMQSGSSLRILSVWGWMNETFPSLERNPSVMWAFFHDGELQWLPSLHMNKKMERLVIRDHHLHTVPNISGLVRLKWLDVQKNRVTSPPNLEDNINLERLMISENRLEQLPNLDKLKDLKKLRAGNNLLCSLPSLAANKLLTVLDLTDNKLVNLPDDGFDSNTNLKEIKISENRLENLPRISSLTRLKEFDVANNRLREIPSLDGTNVWMLNVSGNLLTELPPLNLQNLTIVDVCDNRFADPGPKVALGSRKDKWKCFCCRYPWFER